MFKGNKKSLLVRYCKTCNKPMSWRKKWERCWDEVMYCSARCRRNRAAQPKDEADIKTARNA
ncbi:hypothetical protein SAMN05428971_4229 [Candidatus Pantoea varia]|uniref:DUF2256 domain-containing protein n=1 Tax=Candidatus Pantoea varia TaxID=1881036 RepID=A0A1I5HQ94_9GAMM|nr:DUF2256 domain-containing protein [Pantoea varia]SFO50076.1 hypothetical protein SAMN05428971_4229 [Pantoea varia]